VTVKKRIFFTYLYLDNTTGMTHLKITYYSLSILMKLVLFGMMCEKFSNIDLHHNPSSGNRVVLCGLTDMTNDRFSKCCKCA